MDFNSLNKGDDIYILRKESDGIAFWRWYGDCCKKGIVIDWESYC